MCDRILAELSESSRPEASSQVLALKQEVRASVDYESNTQAPGVSSNFRSGAFGETDIVTKS